MRARLASTQTHMYPVWHVERFKKMYITNVSFTCCYTFKEGLVIDHSEYYMKNGNAVKIRWFTNMLFWLQR